MSLLCRLLGLRWGDLETIFVALSREVRETLTGNELEKLLNGPRRACLRCPAVEW